MQLAKNLFSRSKIIGLVNYRTVSNYTMSKPAAFIEATDKHTASLIFLHGLGDVGETWVEEFKYFHISSKVRHVKYIFPTAAVMKISKNNGESMTSWFDVHSFTPDAKEDQSGIEAASNLMNKFIEDEINNGIPAERIIIGGFSMGGAVALHTILTTPHKLGGVIALSTWLPLANHFPQGLVDHEKKRMVPILHCHGNRDPIIQLSLTEKGAQIFQQMDFQRYVLKVYDGLEHTNNEQEMKDVCDFIEQSLPHID